VQQEQSVHKVLLVRKELRARQVLQEQREQQAQQVHKVLLVRKV